MANPAPKQTIDYVNHILYMRKYDPDYARQALIDYDKALPWLEIKQGVRKALNEADTYSRTANAKAGKSRNATTKGKT